jgi:8-oxo-dGTP pyrophosphatase MutT (NUDIX family)
MLSALYQQVRACFVLVFDEVGHVAATTRPYEEEEARKMGLPGGLVEEGESLRDCVIREAAEEGWFVEGVHDTPFHIQEVDGNLVAWFLGRQAQMMHEYREQSEGITPFWADPSQLLSLGNDVAISKAKCVMHSH